MVEGNGSLAHIGRVALWNDEIPGSRHQNHIIRVRSRRVDPRYLLEWFSSPGGRGCIISEATSASGLYTLSLKKVSRLPVPLPPDEEQRRIVAKIEALFARSRRAKEALDAIPPLLDRLRQSILAAAFRGDLTADWRAQHPDVEPADKLLERIRIERRRRWEEAELAKMRAKGKEPKNDKWKSKYTPADRCSEELPDGLPRTWAVARLDDFLADGGVFDGARDHGKKTPARLNLRTSDYTTAGVRVIRLENLQHLRFVEEKRTFISADKFDGLKQEPIKPGDLLVGSFIAEEIRTCLVPKDLGLAITKADCFCVRPMTTELQTPYLSLYLAAPVVLNQLLRMSHGATRPRVSTRQLRQVEVILCPLQEQVEIVSRVGQSLRLVDSLSERVRAATARVQRLEDSILGAAFSGQFDGSSGVHVHSGEPRRELEEDSAGRERTAQEQLLLPLGRPPGEYSRDDWRACLLRVVDYEPVERDDAVRLAAEWARDNLGLEYKRLPKTGQIVKGLKSAMTSAIRRGELERVGSAKIRRADP